VTDRPRISDTPEIEYKLAVIGDDPQATFDAVGRLDQLAGQRLGPPTRHLIHDRYWDTDDRALGSQRVTLRLREIDGALKFTLKGGGSSSSGLFERQELELPADAASWRVVVQALDGQGVRLRRSRPDSPDPADWPASFGLIVTQDRVTERVVRHAYGAEEPIAELALDTTRYRFGDRTVDYREIEVEQLAGAEESARTLGEALLARFPGRLEPATMGKYHRGLLLERELGT
jgi:inorganic triphosphatase YgiF